MGIGHRERSFIAEGRRRPGRARRPNPFFRDLNRDTRALIYEYLSFPPLLYLHPEGRNFLALTCRQAREETAAEGVRQLWMFLQKSGSKALAKAGSDLCLPRTITSKYDLAGLKELIIVNSEPRCGRLDLSGSTQHLPQGHPELLRLHIDTLRFHYTNTRPGLPGIAEAACYAFLFAVNDFIHKHLYMQARTVIISWDYREDKRATTLEGTHMELKPDPMLDSDRCYQHPSNARSFPTLTTATDRNETVGIVSLKPESRGEGVSYCPSDLHGLFVDMIHNNKNILPVTTPIAIRVDVQPVEAP